MSKDQKSPDSDGLTQNQNNAMSDDPGDGGRKSMTLGGDTETPLAQAPGKDDQERLAELGRRGSKQD